MLRTTLLPEPNGTSLGNVATSTLETAGRTYHNLRFQALGVGASTGGTGTILDIRNVVEYVRVLVNSKEVMKFNPKEKRTQRSNAASASNCDRGQDRSASTRRRKRVEHSATMPRRRGLASVSK